MAEAEQETTAPAPKNNPITVIRTEMQGMESQFKAALPEHIPVERFIRVVMTAVQNNPDLQKCSRRSFFNACIKAAQDGLLPDGREGAIVGYGGEAQWLPMIFGIRKKVRNSGEVADWDVQLVYENDHFEHELGDQAFIRHRRAMGPRGNIVGVYSIAHMKGGGVSREIMSIDEIEKVRTKSKSKKGPWQDPVFYPEMVRKTIARRHSKNLPMSSDLDDLVRRDDSLYGFDEAKIEQHNRPRSLNTALDQLAGEGGPEKVRKPVDETPAEEVHPAQNENPEPQGGGDGAPAEQQHGQEGNSGPSQNEGAAAPHGPSNNAANPPAAPSAAKDKHPAAPKTEKQYIEYAKVIIAETVKETLIDLRRWWTSEDQKKLRNKCNVSPETREELFELVVAREKTLGGENGQGA